MKELLSQKNFTVEAVWNTKVFRCSKRSAGCNFPGRWGAGLSNAFSHPGGRNPGNAVR